MDRSRVKYLFSNVFGVSFFEILDTFSSRKRKRKNFREGGKNLKGRMVPETDDSLSAQGEAPTDPHY
jgi:hypothetical protein